MVSVETGARVLEIADTVAMAGALELLRGARSMRRAWAHAASISGLLR